jgi:hypothetical protein
MDIPRTERKYLIFLNSLDGINSPVDSRGKEIESRKKGL